MVNIQNFWPPDSAVPEYSRVEVGRLIQRRFHVSQGFAELEKTQGHYPQIVDLAMPETQDYMRLLGFRFLEELSESLDSVDEAHRLEELIDAINYLLNMAMLDPRYISDGNLVDAFEKAAEVWDSDSRNILTTSDSNVVNVLTMICGQMADTLRNRSWMEQAQDIQWAGKQTFLNVFTETLTFLLSEFPNWDVFWKYFVAKDDVLQFRLETRY